MKKVLYISNIEVPYRSEFFNLLSEKVELTVLYEREKSSNRDEQWTNSVEANYQILYLRGIEYRNEYAINPGIIKYILLGKYDFVVLGCFNSPSQLLAATIMKVIKKKYIMNIDGEYYFEGKGIKKILKRVLIKGADSYFVAGKVAAERLKKVMPYARIVPYLFSSLNQKQMAENVKCLNQNKNDEIIVIGQYFAYKGLDDAIECARLSPNIQYKFIGAGNRSAELIRVIKEKKIKNIEVVPFLSKQDLYKEYQNAKAMLLPSRQECWGLVINEAASFGCPIVSTYGSGAAVEFLAENYPGFLAKEGNGEQLYDALRRLLETNETDILNYKKYLIQKSKFYTIENNVDVYMSMFSK